MNIQTFNLLVPLVACGSLGVLILLVARQSLRRNTAVCSQFEEISGATSDELIGTYSLGYIHSEDKVASIEYRGKRGR